MPESMNVMVQTVDGVRTITFNRPDARNAFNRAMFRDGAAALDTAAEDEAVKVVVLTGEGESFSAGADTREMAEPGASAEESARPFHAFVDALDRFPKPLIAAVNGVAVGLGLTMLAYCDVVLVAESARLRAPFAPMGLAPEAGSSVLFPYRIGWQHTARYFLTGAWINADEAVEIGLAWRTSPADNVVGDAEALAAEMAASPLESLIETKRLLSVSRPSAAEARTRESEVFRRLLAARSRS